MSLIRQVLAEIVLLLFLISLHLNTVPEDEATAGFVIGSWCLGPTFSMAADPGQFYMTS